MPITRLRFLLLIVAGTKEKVVEQVFQLKELFFVLSINARLCFRLHVFEQGQLGKSNLVIERVQHFLPKKFPLGNESAHILPALKISCHCSCHRNDTVLQSVINCCWLCGEHESLNLSHVLASTLTFLTLYQLWPRKGKAAPIGNSELWLLSATMQIESHREVIKTATFYGPFVRRGQVWSN